MENKSNLTSYFLRLVGVSFEGRQDVISLMNGDEQLRFRREPENQYDTNAVAIDAFVYHEADSKEWLPIGYISKDKNKELAEALTEGREANIKLSGITGGGDKSFGVNVYIEYQKKLRTTRTPNAELVKDFFGNEIFYDDKLHEYTNALGEVYLSGSAYASNDDFDAEHWAKYAVEAYKLHPDAKQKIKDMWECNGEASRNFGSALHKAIELYGTYHELADIIDMDLKKGTRKRIDKRTEKNSALSKLPYLKKVELKFFTKSRLKETAYYEVLVVDHKNKRAGRIDRLVLLPDGSYEVRDLKTNNKISVADKRDHTKQLSFYADLLLANGCTLGSNPIGVHHWNEDTWKDIGLEKIDTLDVLPTESLSRQE
jgi:hypothetical protein